MTTPSPPERPATGRSFFEAPIPIALLTCERAPVLLQTNAALERLLGRRRDAVIGGPLHQLVSAAEVDELHACFAPLVDGSDDNVEAVARFVRPDGTTRWARMFAKRFTADDGAPCIIVDLIDIDDEVRAREELRASEERYRLIVHLAREGIWTIDAHGTTSFANDTMAGMLGYTPEEMIGRPFLEFIHPEERGTAVHNLVRRRAGIAEVTVRRLAHRDGHAVWTSSSMGPIIDDSGKFVGAVAMVSDVTEARAAQDALQASERRLSALVEHSWDIIAVLEPDGRVRSISTAATRLLGWTPSESPIELIDLVLVDDLPIIIEAFDEVVKGTRGPDTPVQFRVVTTTGEIRVLESVAQNLVDDPDVNGIVFNSRDVTDRVRADDALREQARHVAQLSADAQQQRLELELARSRRLESIGRLAGGVAHDFNNLLGVITNYAEVLAAGADDESQAAHDIEAIRLAAERGSLLVRRLLRLGGSDGGAVETFDLNALLDELLALAARALGSVEVRFSPDAAPCWLSARRGEIEQIVLNLLVNARDASPAGGVVEVSTGRSGLARHGGMGPAVVPAVVLRVVDHGTGMSAEERALATEPFFTTKPHESGSGLGLTTVLATVERSGGTLALDSELGAGTTVTVTLPAAEPRVAPTDQDRERHARVARAGDRDPCCVLVVDDDLEMLASTERALRMHGYGVLAVASGGAALTILEAGAAPDVLVTDIRMPELSGVELAREVWRRHRLPSVLVTGGADDPDVHDCGSPIVAKPFHIGTLARAIESACGIVVP